MIYKLRKLLWRILGVDYEHILKCVDVSWLHDKYTEWGEHSYANNSMIHRWSDAPVKIGKYCSISYDVRVITDDGSHLYNTISNYPFSWNKISNKCGITIGNDVWIGLKCIILPGVKIGNGVTIAAGSVVTKDIPDYCVAGGVPADIIRYKCTPEEASKMNEIAWWDWDESIIEERKDNFRLSIPDFIYKYKK